MTVLRTLTICLATLLLATPLSAAAAEPPLDKNCGSMHLDNGARKVTTASGTSCSSARNTVRAWVNAHPNRAGRDVIRLKTRDEKPVIARLSRKKTTPSAHLLLIGLMVAVGLVAVLLVRRHLRRRASQTLIIRTQLEDPVVAKAARTAFKRTGWRSEIEPGRVWGQGSDMYPSMVCMRHSEDTFLVRAKWAGQDSGAFPKRPMGILYRRWYLVRRLRKKDKTLTAERKDGYIELQNERSMLE